MQTKKSANKIIFSETEEANIWASLFSKKTREALPSYDAPRTSVSPLGYASDYSDLWLLVEPLGDTYCAYLKDYNYGYIKGFGESIYDVEDYDEQAQSSDIDVALDDLSKRIDSGEINLDEEFYNYYHDLPAEALTFRNYLEGLISVKDAAQALSLSESRIKAMVADRALDGYKYRGKIFINPESIKLRAEGVKPVVKQKTNRMTHEMAEACYDSAVLISRGVSSVSFERDKIVRETGMNRASATYYINAVLAMLHNDKIGGDINKASVEYYLDRIGKDFGKDAQRTAAKVCMQRYKDTKVNGNTCFYYKRLAEKYIPAED